MEEISKMSKFNSCLFTALKIAENSQIYLTPIYFRSLCLTSHQRTSLTSRPSRNFSCSLIHSATFTPVTSLSRQSFNQFDCRPSATTSQLYSTDKKKISTKCWANPKSALLMSNNKPHYRVSNNVESCLPQLHLFTLIFGP